MEEKKLFLLDAYALIYRAYYALMRSPRFTAGGLNTSAIFGFCNTLDDVLKKENPGYIAVCFDPAGGHTFRHEQYAEYKAGRDKQPEDITLSIPYIKRILEAYRIPAIEVPGFEADDVIGTLSRMAQEADFTTYMMTPDKDYGQLVTDRVFMYRPALKGQGFEIRGPQQVCERYGISSPRQVIDLLALEGDASDNVPGCPGVGEKTAAKLIAQFGSVENMLEHTDQIKGALQAKIVDNEALIRMSKELVTIITDAPVDIKIDELRRTEPDIDALREIYKELEFKTFLTKLGGEAPAPPKVEAGAQLSLFDFSEETPALPLDVTFDIRELSTPEEVVPFMDKVLKYSTVGMAINSLGAEAMTAEIAGIAFAVETGGKTESAYIRLDAESRAELATLIEPLFSKKGVTIVNDDIKRSMLILKRLGIEWTGPEWFDTAVAHYLVAPEGKHDTPTLSMNLLNFRSYGYDLSPAERKHFPLDGAAVLCETASLMLKLKPVLEREVEQRGQTALMREIEFPLVSVLASMEWEGARIDVAELNRLGKQLTERINALEKEAYAIAGHAFNASSPAQVGQVLFEEMGIDPKAKRTKGGAYSTAEDVLEKYAKTVPLVQIILDIRGLKKLLATYVEALPKLINPKTGKLHTTYNQTVTATGRISSTNPNLQNIPIRTADGRDIRRAFIPDEGDLMLSADYSQIELRLMADMSADAAMTEAFLSGEDIHRATAAKIYHLPLEEVTDTQRRNAKTANFGIIYGISAFGLSERLGISRTEAKELIEGYLTTYPDVAKYMQTSIERAREHGYVTTILGRRRYLPDINSRSNTVRGYAERNAINAPLQGSAADIIKRAMIDVDAEIRRRGLKSRMILQVHDELVFNVKPDELETLKEIVVSKMEGAYKGSIPMEVAAGVGQNWLEAH